MFLTTEKNILSSKQQLFCAQERRVLPHTRSTCNSSFLAPPDGDECDAGANTVIAAPPDVVVIACATTLVARIRKNVLPTIFRRAHVTAGGVVSSAKNPLNAILFARTPSRQVVCKPLLLQPFMSMHDSRANGRCGRSRAATFVTTVCTVAAVVVD